MKFSAALLSLMFLSTSAQASSAWPNEPAGSSVIYDCAFSNNVCNLVKDYSTQTDIFINDPAGPLSPGGALDSAMYANSYTGNGAWHLGLGGAKEIFFGTYWRTNSDFEGMCNNSNKLFFFRRPEVDNSLLGWYGTPGTNAKTLWWVNQTAYSNARVPGWWGDPSGLSGGFFPNVGNGNVAPGSPWQKIELYLKSSSGAQSFDGIIRWWLNGVMIGNITGVNQSPGGFTEFNLNHAWDGSPCRTLGKEWHHYIDHMHISVPNGGGSIVIPPVINAPTKPQNLRFI